jgi:hypothetical protein
MKHVCTKNLSRRSVKISWNHVIVYILADLSLLIRLVKRLLRKLSVRERDKHTLQKIAFVFSNFCRFPAGSLACTYMFCP